ncbi:MAG: histidinol-phosphate transaminase, partial [Candidatus Hydrogenedentota bacterium]
MSIFYRKSLKNFKAYIPGEQYNEVYVKLNTNENPYSVNIAFDKSVIDSLNKYPEPLSLQLRAKIAKKCGIKRQNVIAGAGSDEILRLIFQAFIDPGDKIAYSVPTYTLYKVLGKMFNAKVIEFKPARDLGINRDIIKSSVKIVFVCTPNSPTGIVTDLDVIKEILEARKERLVIVDEAYAEFCKITAIPLIKRYRNLIVLRTFSKSHSLAGLRLGFGFGDNELIDELLSVKDSYNLNRITQYIGSIAVDMDISENVEKIIRERERVKKSLEEMDLFVYNSGSNFLLLRIKNAKEVYQKLKEKKVL